MILLFLIFFLFNNENFKFKIMNLFAGFAIVDSSQLSRLDLPCKKEKTFKVVAKLLTKLYFFHQIIVEIIRKISFQSEFLLEFFARRAYVQSI
jgi:hypothetical protein